MRVVSLFLFFTLAQSYVYYNHYRLKYPNYIIKKTRYHKDLNQIDYKLARKVSKVWFDELKIKHIMENNQNINLLYKSDKSYNEETTNEYVDFMYDIETEPDDFKYLLWKPKMKPLIIKDGNEDSSILYPSFREALSVISYKENKEKNIINVNEFVVSPYIRSDENTNIHKQIKNVLINYFLGYLKFNKIEFKSSSSCKGS